MKEIFLEDFRKSSFFKIIEKALYKLLNGGIIIEGKIRSVLGHKNF